jgi:hypothetical protein
VSPNQMGHSTDDNDNEENQTHLQQSVLDRDAYLHCGQCCYVTIGGKGRCSAHLRNRVGA